MVKGSTSEKGRSPTTRSGAAKVSSEKQRVDSNDDANREPSSDGESARTPKSSSRRERKSSAPAASKSPDLKQPPKKGRRKKSPSKGIRLETLRPPNLDNDQTYEDGDIVVARLGAKHPWWPAVVHYWPPTEWKEKGVLKSRKVPENTHTAVRWIYDNDNAESSIVRLSQVRPYMEGKDLIDLSLEAVRGEVKKQLSAAFGRTKAILEQRDDWPVTVQEVLELKRPRAGHTDSEESEEYEDEEDGPLVQSPPPRQQKRGRSPSPARQRDPEPTGKQSPEPTGRQKPEPRGSRSPEPTSGKRMPEPRGSRSPEPLGDTRMPEPMGDRQVSEPTGDRRSTQASAKKAKKQQKVRGDVEEGPSDEEMPSAAPTKKNGTRERQEKKETPHPTVESPAESRNAPSDDLSDNRSQTSHENNRADENSHPNPDESVEAAAAEQPVSTLIVDGSSDESDGDRGRSPHSLERDPAE